ncbi:MAG: chromosome partitioning protein ParA [Mycoplasmataceae bacterium RV_VA103A]|nr:MAG: chromosome partitioning protein ParA [Mycoplasmataceae bacterium RV_VA103A]
MVNKIVITNEKGGTGKSTVAALLVEYLNYKKQKVQLIDTDPLQTSQTWANNCQMVGRQVSLLPADYQIIDTAGSSGSALGWIRQADLIVVPFQAHYPDLKVVCDWFSTLHPNLQQKIILLPNRWQNTKEQREGLGQLQVIIKNTGAFLLPPLNNRPALYGTLLNGGKVNFFTNKQPEAENLLQLLLSKL